MDFLSPRSPADLADWEFFSGHSGRVGMARRMAQNGAPTHEIERQGRWKQGGGMVGHYTRGETAGSALRYLAQNGAPTHEIERQGRWKQGGGMGV